MNLQEIKTVDEAIVYAKRKLILSESCNDVDVKYNRIVLAALQEKKRTDNNESLTEEEMWVIGNDWSLPPVWSERNKLWGKIKIQTPYKSTKKRLTMHFDYGWEWMSDVTSNGKYKIFREPQVVK